MKNKNKSSRKHTVAHSESSTLGNNFRAYGIGVGSSLLSLVLLTFALSAFALIYHDPNKLTFPLSILALFVSSAVGGFISARRSSTSPFVSGLVTGCSLLLIYIFLSFVLKAPRSSDFLHILCFRLSAPVTSILGAFLSVKRKTRKPHRK